MPLKWLILCYVNFNLNEKKKSEHVWLCRLPKENYRLQTEIYVKQILTNGYNQELKKDACGTERNTQNH